MLGYLRWKIVFYRAKRIIKIALDKVFVFIRNIILSLHRQIILNVLTQFFCIPKIIYIAQMCISVFDLTKC